MIRIIVESTTTLERAVVSHRTFDIEAPEVEALLRSPGMYTQSAVVGAEVLTEDKQTPKATEHVHCFMGNPPSHEGCDTCCWCDAPSITEDKQG